MTDERHALPLPPGRADFAPGDEVDFERFDRPRFLPVEP